MRRFGLLGERLSHSFSPSIHSMLSDYEYKLFEKSSNILEEFILNGEFDGLNVTIPYKKAVIPYCASLSAMAEKTGSVNTILRKADGSLHGDNTDCAGFAYMIKELGVNVSGKKALVLGSGGASASVQAVLNEHGAIEVAVISRGGENNYQNIGRHRDARIIVNATPVGMYPECGAPPVDLEDFEDCEAVFDLIYNPARTQLLMKAEDLGIPCINGLSMLVAQAKKASELFQGKTLPDSVIEEITKKISRETRSIVLIGMPGCGKSSIGACLAQLTEREFFDTDEMVGQTAGRSVPDIIKADGEDAFRRLETVALGEAVLKNACVIATGGGIVKVPENRRLIRQNSAAVFLDRDINELSSEGRPLSQRIGVAALAAERMPLYRQWADHTVSASGVEHTALKIKELLGL